MRIPLALLIFLTCTGLHAGPLAQALQPAIDQHAIAGAAVVVADGSRILDSEAVGMADVAAGRPMKPDDLFWIASMSKAMTAASLMMLVDEGKVDLDAPVEAYLPEFKGQKVRLPDGTLKEPSHPPRVREILCHTAGFDFGSPAEKPTRDLLPLAVAVKSYAAEPLIYDPGTQYKYSNEGLNTAGRIVEVVSGMPYEKFMQARLFTPLGMTDTTFFPTAAQVARLAKAYVPDEQGGLKEIQINQLKYPLDGPGRYPMPAGGLFSDAADVVKFCQMLLNDGVADGRRYLSHDALAEMTTSQTRLPDHFYGFGLDVRNGVWSHGGAYKTHMRIDVPHHLIRVFMVQYGGKDWPKVEGKNPVALVDAAVAKTFHEGRPADAAGTEGSNNPSP
ncbi:MAG: serine hydrolase [Verrucomicrobium sp.]|nr:serine hydrolase [Verrucomicrobium sp.]